MIMSRHLNYTSEGINVLTARSIMVTGSAGFIGKNLVKELEKLDVHLIQVDKETGIDLTDWQSINNLDHVDLVYHLAGLSYIPISQTNPRIFYHQNIISTLNMLEYCRIHKAKFIFTSSYIYGSPKYLPIDEKHPVSGLNPYTESKILAESLCYSYYKNYGVKIIIFRPFNVFGPGQNKNFLIPSILGQLKTGKIILNDPNPKRDFIYVDDLINAYIKAASYIKSDFDIFNIGSGKSHSVQDIANLVKLIFSDKLEIHFENKQRENEVNNTIADISKAEVFLGWTPKISLKDGLRKMMD